MAAPEKATTPFEESFHEHVVESQQVMNAKSNPAINGLIAPPEFFRFLQENMSSSRGIMEVIRLGHQKGFRSGIMHGQLINLNYPADYIALREIMSGRLRFPFPPRWTKGFINELETLAERRERKRDYKERLRQDTKHHRKH